MPTPELSPTCDQPSHDSIPSQIIIIIKRKKKSSEISNCSRLIYSRIMLMENRQHPHLLCSNA